MIGFRVETGTLTKTLERLSTLNGKFTPALATSLFGIAEEVMTESKEMVPVDTGALKSTGHVKRPQISGASITVEMGYGGPGVEYAFYVHENLEARHVNGQAKYLEVPLNRRLASIDRELAASIDDLSDVVGFG